jgi:hypothetical protein
MRSRLFGLPQRMRTAPGGDADVVARDQNSGGWMCSVRGFALGFRSEAGGTSAAHTVEVASRC